MRITDKEAELIRNNVLPEPLRAPFPVSRPGHLSKKNFAASKPPLIYCANGRTFTQRLARNEPETPKKRGVTDTVAEYFPSSSPQKPGPAGPPLREKQWRRWTNDVIPKLVPVFLSLWHKTESLRNMEELKIPPLKSCGCKKRKLEVSVVRWSGMCIEYSGARALTRIAGLDHIDIQVCACQTAGEQLLTAGLFPCSPQRPSLAVDVGILEFVKLLFINLPPNNTAFCNTLEGFLASRGFKLMTKVCMRGIAENYY